MTTALGVYMILNHSPFIHVYISLVGFLNVESESFLS